MIGPETQVDSIHPIRSNEDPRQSFDEEKKLLKKTEGIENQPLTPKNFGSREFDTTRLSCDVADDVCQVVAGLLGWRTIVNMFNNISLKLDFTDCKRLVARLS
jgi:hypothetical protein